MGGYFSQQSTDRVEQLPVFAPQPKAAMEVSVTNDDPIPHLAVLKLDGNEDVTARKGKEPELANTEAHGGGPSKQPEPSPPLQLVLCRFEKGSLVKTVKTPESTGFLAISHPWGKADWKKVGGIDDETRVSLFLEKRQNASRNNYHPLLETKCSGWTFSALTSAMTRPELLSLNISRPFSASPEELLPSGIALDSRSAVSKQQEVSVDSFQRVGIGEARTKMIRISTLVMVHMGGISCFNIL